MNWETFKNKVLGLCRLIKSAIDRLFLWAFSLVGTLVIPSTPIGIEYGLDDVKVNTVLTTGTILSASFLFTAEHNFYRVFYICLLIVLIIFDIDAARNQTIGGNVFFAETLLLAVGVLHGSERFWWHVVLDRPFPDNLRRLKQ